MQEIINSSIRGLGHLFLRALTPGRYEPADAATEGGVGLALILGIMALVYWWKPCS
jgi:hypothetical protein